MPEDMGYGTDIAGLDLTDLDPEMIELLKQMGAIPEDMALMNQQLEQANLLRNAPAPEGRDTGRVYSAANPMEHIGALWQKYNANKEAKGIEERQKEAIDILRRGREVPIEAILRAGMRKKATTPPLIPGSGSGEGWM